MSELIDQLRNLRAAAYRKLTQNSDFKVLLELDEMLGRLDPADEPMAPPESPRASSGDDDGEASEDIEAAPPEPAAEPPPAEEPAREEIKLADEPAADVLALSDDGEPDVLLMATADADADTSPENGQEEPAAEAEAISDSETAAEPEPPEAALAAQVDVADADVADEVAADEVAADALETDLPDEPLVAEDMQDGVLADEEAVLAEALAGDIGAEGAPQDGDALDEADVFSGGDTAAAAVAAALSQAPDTPVAANRKPAPPPAPAPVNLAPEEDYDAAAPAGATETSDDAYESALNRLNALIERASTRLKREDSEQNGASIA